MRTLASCLCIFAFACGSSRPPAPQPPSTTPSDAPNASGCVAGMARHKPASGWTQVGSITLYIEDDHAKSFELRDARDNVIESKPAPKGDAKASLAMLEAWTCKLGGVLAALDGDLPTQTGTALFFVLKPAAEDEKADLVLFCKPPEDLPDALEDAQQTRLAFDIYEERLTTKKWRLWLRDLGTKSGALEGAARVAMRAKKADELAAGAKKAGIKSCWFEQRLRKSTP
jgi:hypothetical protein